MRIHPSREKTIFSQNILFIFKIFQNFRKKKPKIISNGKKT